MKKKLKNTQSITLFIPVTYLLGMWKNEFQELPPNQSFQLIIDYPLSRPAIYKINTGKKGMGLSRLLKTIGKKYQQTYNREDASEEGVYGIYGHSIDDLSIEGIKVNYKKKTIRLDVGS